MRIDNAIADLLVNFAGINPSFIPYAKWDAEVARWAPTLTVTTDILKPEGVSKLIGELAVLGISIWWDDVLQEIGLKINRPPDTDAVKELSDRNNIVSISQEDRDEDRLTEVVFYTRVINPTQSTTDEKNFYSGAKLIDADAKSPNSYGDTKIKTIHCRWLNHGDDALVKILSKRLLNRFNKQPVRYVMTVDINDDTALTEVLNVTSFVITDDDGGGVSQLMQVLKREEVINGHHVKLTAQQFAFDDRYGYITENTRPVYGSSSTAQKARGAYMVGGSLTFSDGLKAYKFI